MKRTELTLRIVGMILLSGVGWGVGDYIATRSGAADAFTVPYLRPALALAIAGAGLGLLVTPWCTIRPALWARRKIKQIPARHLFMGIIGMAAGLVISLPLAFSLSFLPSNLRTVMPLLSSLAFGLLGMSIMIMRADDFQYLWSSSIGKGKPRSSDDNVVLLDTSVVIDGRIADISQTGFIERTLLVPRFILDELQYIADSSDALRRKRGRRGLDILSKLQQDSMVPVRVTNMDVEEMRDADGKLVQLAKNLNCPIITNDYNLNRVAQLQGVRVLNINELANAVKTAVLHGETLKVRIIQEGTEQNQGVGYLDDGTMVVVEDGRKYMDQIVDATVTKVLQTAQGRMIFAQPPNRRPRSNSGPT
ncbi:MAG: TRAM domain-containing protein [Anaerolineae bacterium]|nr:TRAM domain-containing protein [Anaerolineae bacterium]